MTLNLQRLRAVIKKETVQLLRDWPTMLMIVFLPIIELFLFAYVGDMTLEHLPTAVVDLSRDAQSRAFVAALEVSGYFDVIRHLESEAAVLRAIDEGEVNVGVVIPPDFATQIERSARGTAAAAQALVIIDGSDSFVVQSAYSAAGAIAQDHGMSLMLETAERMGRPDVGELPITTTARILYNPNIDELVFLIPGLAAVLLQVIAVNATVMSVVRERELGTLEQLLITPTRPVELMLGKLAPAILLIAIDLAIIIALGIYWFRVPFQGSMGLFLLLALLFIVSGLGLGLMLSTISKTQKQAQQTSTVLMLLTMLLSGLIYPRATMPAAIQTVGSFLPATYFIRIARGIITKGIGLTLLWTDVLALAVYATVVVLVSAASFKKRLD